MKLTVQSPIVPLEVEIGDKTVNGRMNLAPTRLGAISKLALKTAEELRSIEESNVAADEAGDLEAFTEGEAKIAEKIAPLVQSVLGKEFYNEILEACGAEEEPAACNGAMYAIMNAISETIGERNAAATNDKAAHYLAEVPDALQADAN